MTTFSESRKAQIKVLQNLDSMSADQVVTNVQQQQTLLDQTVSNRVQNLLTPDQATLLQGVLSRHGINVKAQ
jgi:hypothetical protein